MGAPLARAIEQPQNHPRCRNDVVLHDDHRFAAVPQVAEQPPVSLIVAGHVHVVCAGNRRDRLSAKKAWNIGHDHEGSACDGLWQRNHAEPST